MIKGTDKFKETIQAYLDKAASEDPLFKKNYKKKDKNLDDCVTFILNTVKEADVAGWTDNEIFGMAKHYYDEDDIDIGGDINMQIVVNHKVELTEKEIEEAKKEAKHKVEEEQIRNLKKKRQPKPTATKDAPTQNSLF